MAIKGAEGIVLAADSRVTVGALQAGGQAVIVNFDNASKLLSFNEPHNFVGAVTYGQAIIGRRTAHSFVPEFEVSVKDEPRLSVDEYAQKLSDFYMRVWDEAPGTPKTDEYNGPPMVFLVGGYDEGSAYGKVFLFEIPKNPKPEPRNPDDFGMSWGGQLEIVSRIIQGFDPMLLPLVKKTLDLDDAQVEGLAKALGPALQFKVPYEILPLQDCVDLATFMIRTTISAQTLSIGVRGVGGKIEVATITKTKGLQFVQRKEIRGEANAS